MALLNKHKDQVQIIDLFKPGKDALDFVITYHVGLNSQESDISPKHIIFSRDRGFAIFANHVRVKNGINIECVNTLKDIGLPASDLYSEIELPAKPMDKFTNFNLSLTKPLRSPILFSLLFSFFSPTDKLPNAKEPFSAEIKKHLKQNYTSKIFDNLYNFMLSKGYITKLSRTFFRLNLNITETSEIFKILKRVTLDGPYIIFVSTFRSFVQMRLNLIFSENLFQNLLDYMEKHNYLTKLTSGILCINMKGGLDNPQIKVTSFL
jgi:hypothetical protein